MNNIFSCKKKEVKEELCCFKSVFREECSKSEEEEEKAKN